MMIYESRNEIFVDGTFVRIVDVLRKRMWDEKRRRKGRQTHERKTSSYTKFRIANTSWFESFILSLFSTHHLLNTTMLFSFRYNLQVVRFLSFLYACSCSCDTKFLFPYSCAILRTEYQSQNCFPRLERHILVENRILESIWSTSFSCFVSSLYSRFLPPLTHFLQLLFTFTPFCTLFS